MTSLTPDGLAQVRGYRPDERFYWHNARGPPGRQLKRLFRRDVSLTTGGVAAAASRALFVYLPFGYKEK